jgi:hypothetical protein
VTDPRETEPPERGNEEPQQDDARLEYSIAAAEWDEQWDEELRDD